MEDIDNCPGDIEPAEANLPNEQTMQSRSPRTGAAKGVSEYETLIPPSAYLVPTADEGATDLVDKRRQDTSIDDGTDPNQFISKSISYLRWVGSRHGDDDVSAPDTAEDEETGAEDTFDWALFGREAGFPSNKRPPMTGFLFGPLSVQRKTTTKAKSRIPQANDIQIEGGNDRVSSIDAKKAITACIDNGLQLNGSVRDLLAAQIGGNRPPTPEGSAERDLKSEAEPTEPARTAPQVPSAPEAILISDDEDEHLALPASRSAIDQIPEARYRKSQDYLHCTLFGRWRPSSLLSTCRDYLPRLHRRFDGWRPH